MGDSVSALFVEKDGCYFSLFGVDPWDIDRDARSYAGPNPVVAHPPCERWGRFWHGSTRKPHQFKLGDDAGCFASALESVRRFGGVLEHPADSHAWAAFGLARPPRAGGWVRADDRGGWTCYVEQGFYGHVSRKPTWLYACKTSLPELRWGRGEQRLHPVALERYGYEKARRIGICAMIGGKDKKRIRNATPPEFRDLLLSIARSCATLEPMPTSRRTPRRPSRKAPRSDLRGSRRVPRVDPHKPVSREAAERGGWIDDGGRDPDLRRYSDLGTAPPSKR